MRYINPFGETDCEAEISILGEEYRKYYFSHTRFNETALDRDVFLIIGRRGSGKTALAQYFLFQQHIRNAVAIDVDEPAVFQIVLQDIASSTQSREVDIPRIAKIWELVIWSVIFREFQDEDIRIKTACIFGDQPGKISQFIRHLFEVLISRFIDTENNLAGEIEGLISDGRIVAGKEAVLELAKRRPIIVAFDTLENYAVDNDAMMRTTAALIQCASSFNRDFAHKNVHLKLFVMAEVFPYLKEQVILNTLKVIRNEIHLHWRPKDLVRLISWRLYHYLRYYDYREARSISVDWDNHTEVRRKVWDRFFGEDILNDRGIPEKTFPYVLSHTQLRPRQLIVLCNKIADIALKNGHFPHFSDEDITSGIKQVQRDLADEVYNSYSSVYPKVGTIVDALTRLPMRFQGNLLDKVASRTAAAWPNGDFSSLNFMRLVVELGIVGRVRQFNERAGFIEADFEYADEGRIFLSEADDCVIHPLFHEKLHIAVEPGLRVYPFPDHEDFKELGQS